ncbi:MAG: sensor histidine kinase [Butyrivibrio sp.]|nr:sensor histidine kinase [Muribaculum sp.]MCM1552644.1 sensor histidine kinase [Butyrivibrio sp.]
MNGKLYWQSKLPFLILQLLCALTLSLFLSAVGNSLDSILLILFAWVLICSIAMIYAYQKRKKEMDKLLQLQRQLREQYLIPELMQTPARADDQVFYFLLKAAEKSMLEHIEAVQRERADYKEYIEQWIHEIKTPITAMKLLCENNQYPFTRELLVELEKTTCFTEQALYYARSEHTEKDYSIREIRLLDIVHNAIADNKYLLTQNDVAINISEFDYTIFSDEKWVRFILDQLIINAVKYRTEQPQIYIYAKRQNDLIYLYVKDNGIGISANDLPRVFEKGFTGENGRLRQNATGIGLYLCKRLCDKLGIGLDIASDTGGTTIGLSFHINHFIHQVQG